MELSPVLTTLLDRDRLAIAGRLAVRDRSTDELVDECERDRRTVLVAIGDLRAAGLVRESCSGRWELDRDALRAAAVSVADVELPMDPVIGFGMTDDERLVLGRFFSGRVLTEIPTQRAKRLVVLQRLALEFEVGRRYDEREINAILGAFNPDWSALRRGLVDEDLLAREPASGGNLYWRSGGRVTDPPPA